MTVYIPVELQRRVRERFANCCAYCRTAEDLTATTFEFEHIVPSSAGGETAFENLCLSCPMCNRHKSDHVLAADAVTQTEVPLFHPQQDRWTDHFSWNAESTEIVGSTPVGRATIVALKMNRPQIIRVRRMWVAMSEHPPDLDQLGNLAVAQGDLPAAAGHFGAGLKIAERLAGSDPANAAWQRDLVVSYSKLAQTQQRAGSGAEASAYLRRCYETLRRMKEAQMHLDPPLVGLLEQLEGQF